MKLRRNRDEKPCQCKKNYGKLRHKSVAIVTKIDGRDKTYDTDAICVTHNYCKVRRNFVTIAMLVPNFFFLVTNYRRYCDASFKFSKKKQNYMRYDNTILPRNMVIPYYIVIW